MNYRKEIEDFVITEVVETDGILQVSGEGDLYCEINVSDALYHHPGGDGYKADRHCDRAAHYHVPAEELWRTSDQFKMVEDVFDQVDKVWKDENDEVIIIPPNIDELRWIPVSERMPTEDDKYIFRTKFTRWKGGHFYGIGQGYLNSFDSYSNEMVASTEITHWMPMPKI